MNAEFETTNRQQEEENDFDLMAILRMGLANWYWFLLSIGICLGLAFFYLKSTPYVYVRTASVLIKDEKNGGQLSSTSAFEDLSMLNIKSNVDNEVLVFKSKRLMTEVARKLRLDVSYQMRCRLQNIELYTQSPIILQFPDATESASLSLKVTPLSDKEVLLSDFQEQEGSTSKVSVIKAHLNDTIITPVGRVVVLPTLYYTKEYYNVPLMVKKSNLQQVAQSYNGSLQSALASKTATIINLSLNDVSPTRAEDVINTLIDVYNEDVINDKNRVAINTSNFINDRLIIIEKELGGVDSDIETYKKENRLTDIVSETGIYLQSTSQYQQEGLGLDNQRTLALYIRDYLNDPSKSAELIPSNTGVSDMNIESQISEYNDLLLKRDKLISNSSDRNPVVMDLNNSLSAMRQTIIRAMDNFVTSLNIKIQNTREQEAQTMRRINAVPTQQKYVLSVERQQKIKEALYLYLLNKREENALSQSITESNARIIDPASGGSIPVSPKSNMILFAALLLGCAIPAGILWLITSLDTRVRDRKDVEGILSVPFLGEIPYRELKKGEKRNTMAVQENGRDSVSEAFRIVRTNMDFMKMETRDIQVVMLTSLNVSAGKTFVSFNLAVSLAQAGKKVVLVDLDIRKGTLSSQVQGTKVGVTNYLSGKETDIDAIIHPSEYHPNLDLISNGPIPPNPAELLLSESLDQLILELKKQYDYVILDNVPSNMIADAVIVNRVADLTLYVIRAGSMDRRQLPEVEKLYRQQKLRNMAVLLNGVKYNHSRYGYYKYGYSYGYGYGLDKKKNR